jgi:UDP-N-acetylglucosamine 2-epimerase (non-hydrolysing)
MINVLTIFGTRPEAIKMAPVVQELAKHPNQIVSRVCVTAQHREMLDQILAFFNIKPDYDLDIMRERQRLSGVTAKVLLRIERVIEQEQPDWVLVQGDTTTTMTAALAAFYNRCKVGHVEAGLRTGDKFQPYPEEINRKIADLISDVHFVPTETNKRNLLLEGFDEDSILVTGNTVIDALLQVVELEYDPGAGPLGRLPFDRRILLVTAHRRESFGSPLRNICRALLQLATLYGSEVHIVYPVHRNPNVQTVVHEMLLGQPNVSLLDPLDYQDFVQLMNRSYLILTDSGGLQEEAPSLGKPVLVLREVTERPEAVAAGAVRVVGTDCEAIVRETKRLLDDSELYQRMSTAVNPYGDGQASRRIVEALLLNADDRSKQGQVGMPDIVSVACGEMQDAVSRYRENPMFGGRLTAGSRL